MECQYDEAVGIGNKFSRLYVFTFTALNVPPDDNRWDSRNEMTNNTTSEFYALNHDLWNGPAFIREESKSCLVVYCYKLFRLK